MLLQSLSRRLAAAWPFHPKVLTANGDCTQSNALQRPWTQRRATVETWARAKPTPNSHRPRRRAERESPEKPWRQEDGRAGEGKSCWLVSPIAAVRAPPNWSVLRLLLPSIASWECRLVGRSARSAAEPKTGTAAAARNSRTTRRGTVSVVCQSCPLSAAQANLYRAPRRRSGADEVLVVLKLCLL